MCIYIIYIAPNIYGRCVSLHIHPYTLSNVMIPCKKTRHRKRGRPLKRRLMQLPKYLFRNNSKEDRVKYIFFSSLCMRHGRRLIGGDGGTRRHSLHLEVDSIGNSHTHTFSVHKKMYRHRPYNETDHSLSYNPISV